MEREPYLNHNPAIYNGTDKVMHTSDTNHPKALLIRNQYLLSNCSQIVCYYDGQHSETMYMVNRAVKIGLPIINVYEELSDYFTGTSISKE